MTTTREREIGAYIEAWDGNGPGIAPGWCVCVVVESLDSGAVRVKRGKPHYVVEADPNMRRWFTVFRAASAALGVPQR
jgi:hypothetical protein